MTAQTGLSMMLRLGASGAGGSIAGFRAHTIRLDNQMVDVTNKDSNRFRTLLAGAGVRSITLSGNGTVDSQATFETFQGNAMNDTFATYNLIFGDGDTIEALFQITNFEMSGEYNGEQTFTCTLESSGAWTFSAA